MYSGNNVWKVVSGSDSRFWLVLKTASYIFSCGGPTAYDIFLWGVGDVLSRMHSLEV